jgi:hypothetical protein
MTIKQRNPDAPEAAELLQPGGELLPLDQAADSAYRRITEKSELLEAAGDDYQTALSLAAMALSMVAPIYERSDGAAELKPLSAHAINERLFRRVREGKAQRRRGLFMRNDDLGHAIDLLKAAHTAFRPEGLRFGKDRDAS